jgi:hypothetical protein
MMNIAIFDYLAGFAFAVWLHGATGWQHDFLDAGDIDGYLAFHTRGGKTASSADFRPLKPAGPPLVQDKAATPHRAIRMTANPRECFRARER